MYFVCIYVFVTTQIAVINSVSLFIPKILFSSMVLINYTYEMMRRLIFSRSRQHLAVYIVSYRLPNKYIDHKPANTCQQISQVLLKWYNHQFTCKRTISIHWIERFTDKGYMRIDEKNVQYVLHNISISLLS